MSEDNSTNRKNQEEDKHPKPKDVQVPKSSEAQSFEMEKRHEEARAAAAQVLPEVTETAEKKAVREAKLALAHEEYNKYFQKRKGHGYGLIPPTWEQVKAEIMAIKDTEKVDIWMSPLLQSYDAQKKKKYAETKAEAVVYFKPLSRSDDSDVELKMLDSLYEYYVYSKRTEDPGVLKIVDSYKDRLMDLCRRGVKAQDGYLMRQTNNLFEQFADEVDKIRKD